MEPFEAFSPTDLGILALLLYFAGVSLVASILLDPDMGRGAPLDERGERRARHAVYLRIVTAGTAAAAMLMISGYDSTFSLIGGVVVSLVLLYFSRA